MKLILSLSLLLMSPIALAEEAAAPADTTGAEELDVDNIKKKYWARGKKSRMGVVQNRTYKKAGKIQLGLMGGVLFSDPFLSLTNYGLTAGFHFNEFFGLNLLGYKYSVDPSSALETFEKDRDATTNTNIADWYVGLEGTASILYGKLSLLGAKIIYYDMHFILGGGLTSTESGNYITPSGGLGQRFYINKFTSLRIDYRGFFFREDILEKVIPTKLGTVQGTRSNFSHSISFGVDFMFGFSDKKKKRKKAK